MRTKTVTQGIAAPGQERRCRKQTPPEKQQRDRRRSLECEPRKNEICSYMKGEVGATTVPPSERSRTEPNINSATAGSALGSIV